ncbi:hypothetical protein Tco_0249321 [Tanacetum coccineum]
MAYWAFWIRRIVSFVVFGEGRHGYAVSSLMDTAYWLSEYDPYHQIHVAKTFHEQTDEELTKKEIKQMEADDQAIQTILMGLPENIYAIVDSCDTA